MYVFVFIADVSNVGEPVVIVEVKLTLLVSFLLLSVVDTVVGAEFGVVGAGYGELSTQMIKMNRTYRPI